MRFLHTSDWHFGAADSGRHLADDQEHFIDEICEIISSEKIDAVLIAGDVYDRSVASAEAIKLYDKAMTRICAGLNVPVAVIAGNHDGADRLESCAGLLEAADLYVCGTLKKELRKVCFDDMDVYLLPWITEEKVRSVYPEERDNIKGIEDAYRVVVSRMEDDFDPEKRHVLLAHAYITDSETSTSDKAAVIGTAMQIPAQIFDGFDYVALGHIHKPQDVNDKVRYSGTPMAYSFGKEEDQEKSVTIVDTADMKRKVVPLHPLHRRTTLTGTFEELLDPNVEENIRNGFIRLKVTDRPVGIAGIAQLREIYPLLLECESRNFESENSLINMTVEQYEEMQADPVKIFESFCREICGMEPDDHKRELFEKVVLMSGETDE